MGVGIEIVFIVLALGFLGGFAAKKVADLINAPAKVAPEVPASVLIEQEEKQYKELVEKADKQRRLVTQLTDTVTKARQLLEKRLEAVTEIVKEFEQAKANNANEATLNEIGGRYGKAKDGVAEQEAALKEIQA